MNKIFYNTDSASSTGLLILRIVFGLGMTIHGMSKIQNPFMWMGTDSWAPGIFQALAAVAEFGGGLALIAGLWMPVTCLGIMATMATALATVHIPKGHPFVGGGGGSSELAMLYLAIAAAFLFMGAGKYSLDAFINTGRIPENVKRHKRVRNERSERSETTATAR